MQVASQPRPIHAVYVIITGLGFIHVETMYVAMIYFLMALPLAGREREPVVTGMMPSALLAHQFREWTKQVWSVVSGPHQKHHVLSLPASPGSNATNQISQISSPFQSSGRTPGHCICPRYTQQKKNLVSGASTASVPTWFLAPKACPEPELLFHWL